MDKIFFIGIVTFLFMTISACDAETEFVEDIEDEILDDETMMGSEMEEMSMEEDTTIDLMEEEAGEFVVLGSGIFEPNNPNGIYAVEGSFEILRNADGLITVEISEDFKVVSKSSGGDAPDLVIYLSNENNDDDNATFISEDILGTTAQIFEVPSNVNPDDYTYVLLYCRDFNFEIGFGEIER